MMSIIQMTLIPNFIQTEAFDTPLLGEQRAAQWSREHQAEDKN